MNDLVNAVLEQRAQLVLENHKHCLENNISEAIQAGMPSDKIAEIAFTVGFVHGVIDVIETKKN